MERESLLTMKLFLAASFIVFCVLAVALLGAAA
jgi:nitrate reductase NapE component